MLIVSMFAHRSTVELGKQRQGAAKGKQQTTRSTGSHRMTQVELSAESRQGRALEEHQMLMSEIMWVSKSRNKMAWLTEEVKKHSD